VDCPASCLGNPDSSPTPLPIPHSRLPPALPRHHDLADLSNVPRPSSLAPHEIHPRR
jgi:hypothetical protein